ncbi:uncharacterized protein LOC113157232 [Anabas testudineus]|uniref:Ig-like domain-containing protein n=1 Tax=Anabas testudineus TaxID=64144 RepID=A0A7N6FGF7_ANATE|nr:uncharacterized protein LOC113157232 [Anabas testudineus]
MGPLCIFLLLLSEICQLSAVVKTSGVIQDSGIVTAEVGQNVTLRCSSESNAVTFLSWYQQSLGKKPNIISTRMKHSSEADIYPAFKERFQVVTTRGHYSNDLEIRDLRLSDSATYYCGILEFNAIEFGQGAFLHVKKSMSNFQAAVHQPALVPHQPGDSVNLSCTVNAEPCAGEQNLFWFRHSASLPAIMYFSEEQCTSFTNEKTHIKNCTSTLTIKSGRLPDASTYYCALASCGEIVFGKGTRMEITGSTSVLPLLVHILSVALAVSVIVLLALSFVMYKLKKTLCSVCKGSVSHLADAAASDALARDADALHYAALSLNRKVKRHREEDNADTACVYSKVKSRKE